MWICLIGVGWLCCLTIAMQDFRRREIHVVPLLLFGLLGAGLRYQEWGSMFWRLWLTNSLIVGILLGTILLYFRLRGDAEVMDVKLGWGDIVMLLTLAAWMEPLHFLVLYSATTSLLSLGYGLLRKLQRIDASYPIPLAGWLAIGFWAWSAYGLFT